MTTTASLPTDGYLTHQGEPWWFGGSMFEFLVPSDSTGGQITVFRYTAPGGFAPPRHVHTREDEVFHVLEGHVASRSTVAGSSPAPGRRCGCHAGYRTASASRVRWP
ncbi:MAG: hypothetical protein ACJ756_10795 [Solirubrobacterales bacterium]